MVTVIVLTAVPPGLRGHLTRWLLEISPGVFVGHISARVREEMWTRIVEFVAEGRALMVHSVRGEQRLAFQVHGHDWTPVDFDGITLMRRQSTPDYVPSAYAPAVQRKDQPSPGTAPTSPSAPNAETVWKRRNARRKFKRKNE
ncbi:type I-E CRISPR-associated endoribonuclease Cas2e [Saccharopolyspora sp. ID03-671]|uniref:type I-E CRISPR-associated endoribonuclease Cas2e n=1 Tax=Saccharopolyspora sp. ID03-671 TaxID=3073066 RepID=UPI0032456757